MKTNDGFFSDIAREARTYGNSQKQILKLKVAQKASKAGAVLITGITVLILALLTLIFASLALADAFTILWGHKWAGYLSVTVIYLIIIFLMFWLLKKGIIQNIIVRKAFQEKPHIRNTTDLDKEINALKQETAAQEKSFKESFINPTKYIIPLKVLTWLIKAFFKKK